MKKQAGRRNFLIISDVGCAGDLAYTVGQEGHGVRYFIRDPDDREVSTGFVEKVASWRRHVAWADVIVFADINFSAEAERLRRAGRVVLGGNRYSNRLELDRGFAQREMRAAGLAVLPCRDFRSFAEARAHVRRHPNRYVIKPNGKAQCDKVLTFVGQEEDGKDVLAILEHYERGWASRIRSFQLQQYAHGVEVAIGGFFNGREFIRPLCVNFEHKRMFNHEIGPTTGEMGTAMFWSGPNRLHEKTLALMKPRLARAGFSGYFDINCIATPRGIHPIEITPRFGYPTVNIQMEGVPGGWGDLLHALARGDDFALAARRGFQVGVVVAVPPYPFEEPEAFVKYSKEAPVIFRKRMSRGVHHADIKLVDGNWRLTGCSGYALIVTGSGLTMQAARRCAYGRLKNIVIPNMFYRTDIGERWARDAQKLRRWGYL